MDYKVTLAMPVYNVEKYIERALLSALNQTFDSMEFLIVDDKGTDNSMDIVSRIVASHPCGKNVRIIDHGVNRGVGAVRNTAIKEAKGRYIYFMDSDDEITPDCIWLLYDAMQKNHVDFVAASYVRKDTQGKTVSEYVYKDAVLSVSDKKMADWVYNDNLAIEVTVWNKLYDLSFLREHEISCLPRHFSEDILFTFQLVLKAASCVLLSDITYYYYVIPNSITDEKSRTRERSTEIAKQHIEILDFKKRYLRDYTCESWYLRALALLMPESFFYAYWILKSSIKEKRQYVNRMLCSPMKWPEVARYNKAKAYLFYLLTLSPYFIKVSAINLYHKYTLSKRNG